MKATLLASSATVAGIEKLVNKFWFSAQYVVDPESLEIRHPQRSAPEGFRVVKQKGRYRFEAI